VNGVKAINQDKHSWIPHPDIKLDTSHATGWVVLKDHCNEELGIPRFTTGNGVPIYTYSKDRAARYNGAIQITFYHNETNGYLHGLLTERMRKSKVSELLLKVRFNFGGKDEIDVIFGYARKVATNTDPKCPIVVNAPTHHTKDDTRCVAIMLRAYEDG
jgi:hypothetical protein